MKKSPHWLCYSRFLLFTFCLLLFIIHSCKTPEEKQSITQDTVTLIHPLDRILSEIDFARRLGEFFPGHKQKWDDLISEAQKAVNDFVAETDPQNLSEAVARAETEFSKISIYNNYYVDEAVQSGPGLFPEFQRKVDYLNEHIRHSGQGRTYLIRAKSIVYEAVARKDNPDLVDLVAEVERILQPVSKVSKTYTVHCIGHAHIDMNWLWPWEETANLTNETFITVLNLMDEFPEFHFTQSQASVYEIIRKDNPELFQEIKRRVQEGRWEVAASQWVEGDKNMAAGESIARHLLYTRQYMKDHFNLLPEDVQIDWEPDAFGHPLSLPAILNRGGVKYYYCSRAGVGIDRPSLFWWESPDGSRILVNLEKESWYNETIDVQRAITLLKFFKETGVRDYMAVYGVGDHGGGPTREDILKCLEMNSWPVFPNFKMNTTKKYFEIIEKKQTDIPVIKLELNPEFTGCYTSQSQIKKFNRYGEVRLYEAESAGVIGMYILGQDYPGERLKEAWIKLLFNQFHDILPGSNVPLSVDYQSGKIQEVFEITSMIQSNTYRSIASSINTSESFKEQIADDQYIDAWAFGAGAGRDANTGNISSAAYTRNKGYCLVAFNPISWSRHDLVKATLWDYLPRSSTGNMEDLSFIMISATGETIPVQFLGAEGSSWAHRYIDMVFPAEINAFGYNTYLLTEGPEQDIDQPAVCDISTESGYSLHNQYLDVTIDPVSGSISHLRNKTSNTNYAVSGNPLAALEYLIEEENNMSAWTIGNFRERIYPLKLKSIEKGLDGPYLTSVKSTYIINQSEVTITYLLEYQNPYLELQVDMDWKEIGSEKAGTPMLRIMFPFPFDNSRASYEIPYGSIERIQKQGEEVVALRWANVNGLLSYNQQPAGCLLLNDCKYGHSLNNNVLKVTLIRSSFYPDPYPEIGNHTVRLALMPHLQEITTKDFVRLASEFSHSIKVVNTDIHDGGLASTTGNLVSVEPDNVILTSIKKAEDDNNLVIRMYETEGNPANVRISLNPEIFGKIKKVTEVDLLEKPVSGSAKVIDDHSFSIGVPAYGISSVKVDLKKKNK